jgi:hypothetical protein
VRTPRVVVIDVTGLEGIDLETVDALARASLELRRCGAEPRVVGAGLELAGLLRLCGLAEALGVDAVARTVGQARREPEQWVETTGIQEEGDACDLGAVRLEDLE